MTTMQINVQVLEGSLVLGYVTVKLHKDGSRLEMVSNIITGCRSTLPNDISALCLNAEQVSPESGVTRAVYKIALRGKNGKGTSHVNLTYYPD